MMKLPDKNTSILVLLLASLICAIFITYPNIACLPWDLNHIDTGFRTPYLMQFIFRYLFFTLFISVLVYYNLRKLDTPVFRKRLLYTLLISAAAYLIYVSVSFLTHYKSDCFTSILLFQFTVACILSAVFGHFMVMTQEQRRKEQEIEQLKVENLQSRYNALTSQINPHFFFNSLNGLTSLIRKKNEDNALEYVDKLSDVFRYILQSDRKGLVTLREELEFIRSFFYMMEVRFANKLQFRTDVPDDMKDHKLPVLSLLPVVENIVVHNTIDSDHIMEVNIGISGNNEVCVSSPVFPKLTKPETNGTGLKNLENRFMLLMNARIRVVNDGSVFRVFLPITR